jgi:GTP-binding protein HflX
LFDRPASGSGNAGAILVQLDFGEGDYAERLEEFKLLVGSAGAQPLAVIGGKRSSPDAALFAGKGKVDEIAEAVRLHDAEIVLFNHELAPGQQRNLEKKLERRVIDRTSLILDIFALRARSHEGKLQVELAQLEHLATRLVRGWTHLERQKGGIGLRGPGETQLETDRRLLGKRVAMLKERLKLHERQRAVRRRARNRAKVLSVSLVGYTNAGKSTLFNALTKAGAYAADQLFATLDTTSRRVYVEGAGQIILSDTVGFIRDLPHSLVAAFHATLEETAQADLLLHVVDSSSPDRDQQIQAVTQVLNEIGAGDVPQIIVWNKIDATGAAPCIDRDADVEPSQTSPDEAEEEKGDHGKIARVRVSARTGAGLDLLRSALAEAFKARAELPAELDPTLNPYQPELR